MIDEMIDKDPVQDQEEEAEVQAVVPQSTANQPMTSETRLNSLWNLPPAVMHEAQMKAQKVRMSHGMLAGVPILCKGPDCPYEKVCTITPANRIIGYRCPLEAAAVISRFEAYCAHFKIDISMEYPHEDDVVDLSIIKDLVDIEIQILRADNKVAINGDFITKTVGTVDSRGRAYYEDAIDQASEYKMRLLDKKWKTLQLLDSTRKDKSNKQKALNDPSVKAASIFSKISSMVANQAQESYEVVDAEYTTVDSEE